MKKAYLFSLVIFFITGCSQNIKKNTNLSIDMNAEKLQVVKLLDSLNTAAAKADFTTYFSLYNSDGVFTGTDATERWVKPAFMIWAKPIFAKGKAWNFTALERNIFIDKSGQFAWFDELLNTQMKICRGSGVLVKVNNTWKIQQYILSTTIPNDSMNSVLKIKGPIEDEMIKKMIEGKL